MQKTQMNEVAFEATSADTNPNRTHKDWPIPRQFCRDLPPVEPFSYELLPPVLQRRVRDIAERMQCPPDFVAVALLITLATVVGRGFVIAPKRFDSWKVVPNLWGMIVGRPGVMKSPPLKEILRHLERMIERAQHSFESSELDHRAAQLLATEGERLKKEQIRKLLKAGKLEAAHDTAREAIIESDRQPVLRRHQVNDPTVEKLGEILSQNPQGVMLFRDELPGFFDKLEQSGHEADKAFYLEAWNGDSSFTCDRIGRGTLFIRAMCLSVLGGIQPGPLQALVRSAQGSGDNGLVQRFQITVWPDISEEWENVDRPPDQAAEDEVQSLLERLDARSAEAIAADESNVLRFSEDAQLVFDAWREDLEHQLRAGTEHPLVEAHLSKYRSLVPSLALLIHLAAEDEGPVGISSLDRALHWARYLETHARRVYSPAVAFEQDSARLLAGRIEKGELGQSFGLRDVYNNGWSGLGTRNQVSAAAKLLLDLDWLRIEVEHTGGRKRTVFHVNPHIQIVKEKS